MNKPVLIIIDMQEKFVAARDPITIANCKKQILLGKKNINPILFIEYHWNGITQPALTSLTLGYAFKDFITKMEDDGSDVIIDYFNRCKINPTELVVCGVNTEFCVFDTVIGLNETKKFNITVVKDACGSQWLKDPEEVFNKMRKQGIKVM